MRNFVATIMLPAIIVATSPLAFAQSGQERPARLILSALDGTTTFAFLEPIELALLLDVGEAPLIRLIERFPGAGSLGRLELREVAVEGQPENAWVAWPFLSPGSMGGAALMPPLPGAKQVQQLRSPLSFSQSAWSPDEKTNTGLRTSATYDVRFTIAHEAAGLRVTSNVLEIVILPATDADIAAYEAVLKDLREADFLPRFYKDRLGWPDANSEISRTRLDAAERISDEHPECSLADIATLYAARAHHQRSVARLYEEDRGISELLKAKRRCETILEKEGVDESIRGRARKELLWVKEAIEL